MRRVVDSIFAAFLFTFYTFALLAQPAAKTTPTVPRLVKFSGAVTDSSGKPLSGLVGITFTLYAEERGGAPLWMETQNIEPDGSGRYTAMLGATRNDGIPAEVFASGQGRWLGVQPQGEAERPRILMVSVPYALQAADAETLGGLPPTAFALAGAQPAAAPAHNVIAGAASSAKPSAQPDLAGTGTAGHLAYWTNTTTLASSVLSQTAGKVGLGTTAPTAQLEVKSASLTAIQGNAASTSGNGVSGIATATTGTPNGVFGSSASATGNGVSGINSSATGPAVGVYGQSAINGVSGVVTGTVGSGVSGTATASTGSANGVYGQADSTSGYGVFGNATTPTGQNNGVYGQTLSPSGNGTVGVNNCTTGGNGVVGVSLAISGTSNGVSGFTSSTIGNGVSGYATSTTGGNNGVYGQAISPDGNGVTGVNESTTGGNGVVGASSATSGSSNGVYGFTSSTAGNGVYGYAIATSGVDNGVYGKTISPSGNGVQGVAYATTGSGVGVSGVSMSNAGTAGLFTTAAGGSILNGYTGATRMFYVDSAGDGYFAGNLTVTGQITKGSGSFRIDHPLDPANQYLSHSFVESPDMMNIYNGNVTTNARGLTTVVLPDYFEALNGDFRYQLTVIGQFAQAIVAKEIDHGRFTIKTSRPNVKVSWQVTGIRHDAYANAHRIPVTEDKPAVEQGTYLHPDVYAQPAQSGASARPASAGLPE